jgi:cation transport ATPase
MFKRTAVVVTTWLLLQRVSKSSPFKHSSFKSISFMRTIFLIHGIYSQVFSGKKDRKSSTSTSTSLQELLFPPQLTAASVAACLIGKLSFFSPLTNARASRILLWIIKLSIPGLLWTAYAETEDPIADSDPCALAAVTLATALGGSANITAAGVILLMLTGGEVLEDYALTRAGDGLRRLIESFRLEGQARKVKIESLNNNNNNNNNKLFQRKTTNVSIENVSVQNLQPGDTIKLLEGETSPTDGVIADHPIVSNSSSCVICNESAISGEPGAVTKYKGDQIYSGTVICEGKCHVLVTKTAEESMGGLILKELREALSDRRKTPMERSCADLARSLTPIAFSVATLSYWWHSRRGKLSNRQLWEIILSVLMAATPCPLSIGVPVAFLSARSSVTNAGITLKSGGALETLSRVTCVVLDKTGTLTTGKMKLASVQFIKNGTHILRRELITAAVESIAVVEQKSGSSHSVATAEYFSHKSSSQPFEVQHSTSHPGKGVTGMLAPASSNAVFHALDETHAIYDVGDSLHIVIGSKKYVNEQTVSLIGSNQGELTFPPSEHTFAEKESRFEVFCSFLVVGKKMLVMTGRLFFIDPLRIGAMSFVSRLKNEYNMRVLVTSGDNSPALKNVARQLNLKDNEWYHCLPDEKAILVKKLKQDGESVLMVGDGLNDTAALAFADVAIAVGTNDLVASVSDIIINSTNNELDKVLGLLDISERTIKIAKRGVIGGMTMSTIQMVCAATGTVPPVINAIVQEIVDLCTVLHAILSPSKFHL